MFITEVVRPFIRKILCSLFTDKCASDEVRDLFSKFSCLRYLFNVTDLNKGFLY